MMELPRNVVFDLPSSSHGYSMPTNPEDDASTYSVDSAISDLTGVSNTASVGEVSLVEQLDLLDHDHHDDFCPQSSSKKTMDGLCQNARKQKLRTEKVQFDVPVPYKRRRSDGSMTDATASTCSSRSTATEDESSSQFTFISSFSNNDTSAQQYEKLLRWNSSTSKTEFRPLEIRFQESCQVVVETSKNENSASLFPGTTTTAATDTCMETKIQNAARIELVLLNKAKEVRQKREQWTAMYKKLTKGIPKEERHLSPRVEDKIARIKSKVRKAARLENDYLKKSKKLRNKRYRWTKVYEHSCREDGGNEPSNLPPLPPSPVGIFKKGFFG